MTNNNIIEKLQQVVSKEPSKWQEDIQFRTDNKKWLKRSQAIALKVLRTLRENGWSQKDLAEKMNVSAQLVNKWVKGNENYTLETISKLELALNIQLMHVVGFESNEMPKIQTIEIYDYKPSHDIPSEMKTSPSEAIIIPFTPTFNTFDKHYNKAI